MRDPQVLYHLARSRHIERRERALQASVIRLPGGNVPRPRVREQIRDWFDIWENHLWDTYRHERDGDPKDA